MRKILPLPLEKYNYLTPTTEILRKGNRVLRKCFCDCGNITYVQTSHITQGTVKSCGCYQDKCNKILRKNPDYYKTEDISGHTCGFLTVLERTNKRGAEGGILWKCECICGEFRYLNNYLLRSGKVKSCGCQKYKNRPKTRKNLSGQVFGRLLVLEAVDFEDGFKWKCLCFCGKYIYTNILSRIKSCGCLSREFNSNRLKSLIGEKNPRWKPNKDRSKRLFNAKDKAWRKEIFIRDHYTCQLCGQYGRSLQAHHLNAWHAFPDERYDLDNGVCLCEKCHNDFHVSYGRKNNTKEQYEEFSNKYYIG